MNFEPVAVVAAECRLPGAATLADFYRNIRNGVCSIREADASFWQGCEVYDKDDAGRANTSYTQLGGFLDPWSLDRRSFRIPPKVIDRMDPVHALGLDLAKRVIDQCEQGAPLPRADTAVIIASVAGGANSRINANHNVQSERWAQSVALAAPGLAATVRAFQDQERQAHPDKREDLALNAEAGTIGGRIANYFDLHGTHYGLDAACGTSLAAVHSACMGLHQREFDAVLVGALGILTPDIFVVNSAARTLSKDGSFPFGADSNGLVPGEGGVMVMLMRLEDARRDGRKVLGVVRGVGYSTNGRAGATWAPSAEAQERAIRGAFEGVPFGMEDVDYVEAHGTSTYAGDGAEYTAMANTYGAARSGDPLPFGSCKSQIGHTVESAGLAGMLRGLFLLSTGILPPTVNVERPRPEVEAGADRLRLQREAAPLTPAQDRPRRAGVSAFGYGGINYHLLLEQPVDDPARLPGRQQGNRGGTTPPRPEREPIAITALEVVAPDAPDAATFWRNLQAGLASSRDLRELVPDLDLYLEDPALRKQTAFLGKAALLQVPDTVDHRLFRILPKQLPGLSDEMLVLLACAANLAERIEATLSTVDRRRAGCIIGQLPDSDREFEIIQSIRFMPWLRALRRFARTRGVDAPWAELRDQLWNDPHLGLRVVDQDTSTAGFGSTLPSILAGSFDFRGKSYAVRAACATGLAALSLAAQELRQRTLDFVLCGAVGSGVGLVNHSAMAAIRALSTQGVGRPYDQDGDGFIMGGGAGLLCLKRLSDAERDGDPVLAVLRDVRGSSDGKGRSLLAPSAAGRQLAMDRTHRSAGVDPAGIGYIEGHGAATTLGDRSEVEALSGALRNRDTVFLGSVKGNVGHQKAAAGMSSLIKTVLCLSERRLVPTPGYRRPSADLDLAERRLEVVTETRPWPAAPDGAPRRAGVNAFGLGGINYYAVLEEFRPGAEARHPAPPPARTAARPPAAPSNTHLWTAHSHADLMRGLAAFAEEGVLPGPVEQAAPYRLAIAADPGPAGAETARRRARMYLAAGQGVASAAHWDSLGVFSGRRSAEPGRVCRLYPGQGSQYPGMLREAAALLPGAEQAVREAAGVLAEDVPDLYEGFWTTDPGQAEAWLSRTEHCQIATLLVSKVLDDWLTARGVPADLHLGHSFGEVVALLGAGGLTYPDALRTAYQRGRIAAGARDGARPQAMAVLFTSSAEGTRLIGRDDRDVVVANRNSRGQVVIAGQADAVGRVLERAAGERVEGRLLPIEQAFHSPLLRPAVAGYRDYLGTVPFRPPTAPVYETLTSRPYPADADPDRLRASLAEQFVLPVYFETMVRDAYDRGARVFVEVGPKRALSSLVGDILAEPDVRTVALLHPKGGETTQLERAATQLWALGLTDVPPGPENRTRSLQT